MNKKFPPLKAPCGYTKAANERSVRRAMVGEVQDQVEHSNEGKFAFGETAKHYRRKKGFYAGVVLRLRPDGPLGLDKLEEFSATFPIKEAKALVRQIEKAIAWIEEAQNLFKNGEAPASTARKL